MNSILMPALFVGHGSPLNALGNNAYSQILNELGKSLPTPKTIMMISAHWETEGTHVLAVNHPPMIYDFAGFPPELSKIDYPVLGSPDCAKKILELISSSYSFLDTSWGLDHGAWAVLKHLYPKADIPVVSLSLNSRLNFKEHYELAQKLRSLRSEGVLILGSGNITHNLYKISWDEKALPYTWAKEFDLKISKALTEWDIDTLLGGAKISSELWKLAHPTFDHYLPLLYVLGVCQKGERVGFSHEAIQNGSMSMRNVCIG